MYAIVWLLKNRNEVNEERYFLYKININKGANLFRPSQLFWQQLSKGPIAYDGKVSYNKYITQIVFPGE